MYAKVFRSLWTGTLYGRSDPQHVFIYLLCHADREGFVDVSPPAIAGATGLPLDRVQAALVELEAPDPNSRSGEQDGRRLERIDAHRPWGWLIVNYMPYRNLKDSDVVREQNRERQRKRRNALSRSVTQGNASSRHVEVEVEADVDAPPPVATQPTAGPRARKPRAPRPQLTLEEIATQFGIPLARVKANAAKIKALGRYSNEYRALLNWCSKDAAEGDGKLPHVNGADSHTNCRTCGHELLQPASIQSGYCGSCTRQAERQARAT